MPGPWQGGRHLAAQTADPRLARHFTPIAAALAENEEHILGELNAAQGDPQDLGGYYMPDPARAAAAMCSSNTLNGILATV